MCAYEFTALVRDARNLSTNKRRQMNRSLVRAYHIQDHIRDPVLAVEELILRLVYELLARKLEIKDVLSCQWYRCPRRDSSHAERIRRLVKCVSSDDHATGVANRCEWLMFKGTLFSLSGYTL